MNDEARKPEQSPGSGTGCAIALLAVNAVLIGLFALTFSQGPYSSFEQELWYRYGSLAFFFAGAVFPGIALANGFRVRILVGWMIAVLFCFLAFALMSGGGI